MGIPRGLFEKMIGTKSVFIIAEAGVNHNGSLQTALRLVDAAKTAGADAVKFQTWKTENVVTRNAKKAAYQLKSTAVKESQFEMLKRLELSYRDFRTIKGYCDRKKIVFLSTADEIESAAFLNGLQPMFKVGSAELTDLPFLRKLAAFNKPVLLSTGMGTIQDIKAALDALRQGGLNKKKIAILHCHSDYPTEYKDANLRAIMTIHEIFGLPVGYSDHTLGIEVTVAAVALGARIIEKHFTLNRHMAGPDHKISLTPAELKVMVTSIRHAEAALGDGIKRPSGKEEKNMPLIRKSIVAKNQIKKGEVFNERNLTVKRPGLGVSPSRWDEVMGRRAKKTYEADEMIKL